LSLFFFGDAAEVVAVHIDDEIGNVGQEVGWGHQIANGGVALDI